MKHKQLVITLGVFIASTLFLLSSCRKINEATTLGGDLIPPVDNITTFDTTLDVEAYNGLLNLLNDSTRSSYGAPHPLTLGYISNDPLFGKTDARMFLELKPTNYPFKFAAVPDSLHLDSVVLVLENAGVWGDTVVPQTVRVFELDPFVDFRPDSSYLLALQNGLTYSHQLGARTFSPTILNDSISAREDSNTANQLRIRLDDAFGLRLLNYDTSSINNPYQTDSAFKTKFKGFALQADAGGNSLMKFNLTGANTKLAIYYRYNKWTGSGADLYDSAVAYFNFKTYDNYLTAGSGSANYIIRDYSGSPFQTAMGNTGPASEIYLQAGAPGSFARVKIPGLTNLPNSVVHRAELIVEQKREDPIYDSLFSPKNLMVDVYDPGLSTFYNRFVPYDFTITQQGPSLGALGVMSIPAKNPSGETIHTWRFNITRYVQNVVNKNDTAYDLRVFAPFYVVDYYKPTKNYSSTLQTATINGAPAEGRVKVFGGNTSSPATNPQRMRLRIIYSKL